MICRNTVYCVAAQSTYKMCVWHSDITSKECCYGNCIFPRFPQTIEYITPQIPTGSHPILQTRLRSMNLWGWTWKIWSATACRRRMQCIMNSRNERRKYLFSVLSKWSSIYNRNPLWMLYIQSLPLYLQCWLHSFLLLFVLLWHMQRLSMSL